MLKTHPLQTAAAVVVAVVDTAFILVLGLHFVALTLIL